MRKVLKLLGLDKKPQDLSSVYKDITANIRLNLIQAAMQFSDNEVFCLTDKSEQRNYHVIFVEGICPKITKEELKNAYRIAIQSALNKKAVIIKTPLLGASDVTPKPRKISKAASAPNLRLNIFKNETNGENWSNILPAHVKNNLDALIEALNLFSNEKFQLYLYVPEEEKFDSIVRYLIPQPENDFQHTAKLTT